MCLVGVLLPYITAMAVSEGVRQQAEISVAAGADIYVASEMYGRNGPVPLALVPEIEKLSGVVKVVPRIVGRTYLGEELAVVVGIDIDDDIAVSEGSKINGSGHALFGEVLARRLGLEVGTEFRFPTNPGLPFTVAGILDPQLSIWSTAMVIIPFGDAEKVFKLPGQASELLIYCRPGTDVHISEQLTMMIKPWDQLPPLRVQTRKIVSNYLERGFASQAGTFAMFYVTVFALAIPALLILSGLGRGVRRREIGIMKATGWQTLEILEMIFFENLLLALAGSLLPIILAVAWLKIGNGIGIAPLFISGSGWLPDFPVPSRFLPLPALLSFVFGFLLTMTGTIIPTWRAAVTSPMTTMGR
jgi:ABC-type lipoprotein release transport system permease subunit